MNHSVVITTLSAMALTLAACGTVEAVAPAQGAKLASEGAPSSPQRSIPDSQIGFHTASVFTSPAPAPFVVNEAEPGNATRVPTGSAEEAPAIPHAVAEYLPITTTEHGCLDCHELGAATPGDDAPRIPASHARDLRNSPDKTGAKVVGARYVCVSCHVPQTGAAPLVDNTFGRGTPPGR